MLKYIFYLLWAMTWQQIGLSAFVLTTAGTVLVLFYDLYLYLAGKEMITTFCRANPWLAWLILWIDGGGLVGLAVHFMAPVKIN
jgi:hypothetical protein